MNVPSYPYPASILQALELVKPCLPWPSVAKMSGVLPSSTVTSGVRVPEGQSRQVTPPGYRTDVGQGITEPCPDGQYRADWLAAEAASSCSQCGEGFSSEPTDQIRKYKSDGQAVILSVRGSAASCYIKPGQGALFSTVTNTYRAINCDQNNYGVSNVTFGLEASPCRDCPFGTRTPNVTVDDGRTSEVFATDGKGKQGFTSSTACAILAGYGYEGSGFLISKCPVGFYNPAGNAGACTRCPDGFTTTDDAAKQASPTDCYLAPGYGYYGEIAQLCPVGTYNDGVNKTELGPCTPCPDQSKTTQAPGSRSAEDCNVWAAGWGSDGQCGGTRPTFGPLGREISASCESCPKAEPGYHFRFPGSTGLNTYVPDTVARVGATSPSDCLTAWGQLGDMSWHMGGTVNMTAMGDNSFTACVDSCGQNSDCQYLTFDYRASSCFLKTVTPMEVGTDRNMQVLAVKAFLAVGTADAASLAPTISEPAGNNPSGANTEALGKAKAQALTSGSYTFWYDVADGVGAMQRSADPAVSTLRACLAACDDNAFCAAVAMQLKAPVATSATARGDHEVTSCSLIIGNTMTSSRRSLTKADVNRLELTSSQSV